MADQPPRLSDLTELQVRRASTIARAARPFGLEAVKAALMCAFEESSLLIHANNGRTTRTDVPLKWRALAALSQEFPHDRVAGEAWTTADSIGMFQQRLMYGYASPDRAGVAALMAVDESTRIFLRGSTYAKTRSFLDPANTRGDIATRIQWANSATAPTTAPTRAWPTNSWPCSG
ncbi:hypothetical protein FDO65_10170 [Nakamurella flava]|uniref:Uncharacterized protein n=1 Tax=Nakamurella flava TaxID=2576308 RepID=A0A4U6QMK7_9ACTN|nr:hypothetical protein [Nakamurella flava]TKV61880.1 hypothetical protein FDO65_10170 [Nakamurella flava]